MAANGNRAPRFDRRRAVAAAAIAGWALALVVAAGPRPDSRTWIGLPALDDLMGVAFVALVIWAIVWTVRVLRVGGGATQTRSANLITLWLGLALAVAILMVNPSLIDRLLELQPEEVAETDAPEVPEADETPPADFEITANQVYIVLAVIGAWAGVTFLARRRTGSDHAFIDGATEPTPDLRVTLDDMVDDLELGSDPRSAVLAAYDRLERALAEQGRPRRPTETPSEHLARVLTRLPVDRTPFLDLALRYELARYSSRPITETDREQATADLTRARDDLADLARP